MHATPGWYGKLPSLGDFASRRLAVEFVEPWDAWLAQGLAQWRESDPAWLDSYLAAPAWCFVLGARVLSLSDRPAGPVWTGVLMPSVDRSGRYFPFTVASALATASAALAPRLVHRLHQTATLAVQAMHDDWQPDRLDEALFALPENGESPPATDAVARLGPALNRVASSGDTLWWLPVEGDDIDLHHSAGLPTGAAFARLFGAHADEPAAP